MASTEFTPTGGGQLKRPNFKIVSGGVYPELAEAVADEVGEDLAKVELKTFPNGERYVRYEESIRGLHIFGIQTFGLYNGYTPDDAFSELEQLADAARRASASEFTAVMPIFPYARQDRQTRGRESNAVAVKLGNLQNNGIDRIVTVDMHSMQSPGAFRGPFDHLTAFPILHAEIKTLMDGEQHRSVIVAPDAGGATMASRMAQSRKIPMVLLPKSRIHGDGDSHIERPDHVEGVGGKICFVYDDMVDTAGTIVTGAETLYDSGARAIVVCATHGLFSAPAIERIRRSRIDRVVVTDTVPQLEPQSQLGDRLTVLPIAPMIAETISRIAINESISKLFGGNNLR
jgi:ribose-phosphate pyrophosphokinase